MRTPRLAILCGLAALLAAGCAQPFWADKSASTSKPALNADGDADKSGAKPGESKTKLSMGRLCERRGQYSQAEMVFKEIIQKEPKNAEAFHRLGVVCAKQGKFKDAYDALAKAEELNPRDAETLSDVGYVYYLNHRFEDSERYLRRAMEVEPNNLKYSNNLALVLGAMGRDQECLALFRRNTAGPQADLNYAFTLAQRGDYQRALAVYDKALSEDRSLRVAADAMIQLSRYTPGSTPGNGSPDPSSANRAVVCASTEPVAIGPRSDPSLVTIAAVPPRGPAQGQPNAPQNGPCGPQYAGAPCNASPWPPNQAYGTYGPNPAYAPGSPVMAAGWQMPNVPPSYAGRTDPPPSAFAGNASGRVPSTGTAMDPMTAGQAMVPGASYTVSQSSTTQLSPGSERPIPCQIGPMAPTGPTAASWYQDAAPAQPQYIATQPYVTR